MALEHLVEERSEVVAGGQAAVGPGCDIGSDHGAVRVHPAPFTCCAGRCSGDSLTAFRRYRLAHGPPPLPEIERPAAAAAPPVTRTVGPARRRDAEALRRALAGFLVIACRSALAESRSPTRRRSGSQTAGRDRPVRRRGRRRQRCVRGRVGASSAARPALDVRRSSRPRSTAVLVYLPFPFLFPWFVARGDRVLALVGTRRAGGGDRGRSAARAALRRVGRGRPRRLRPRARRARDARAHVRARPAGDGLPAAASRPTTPLRVAIFLAGHRARARCSSSARRCSTSTWRRGSGRRGRSGSPLGSPSTTPRSRALATRTDPEEEPWRCT